MGVFGVPVASFGATLSSLGSLWGDFGVPNVDFLIDVCSGIGGLEFASGASGIRGIRGNGGRNCGSDPLSTHAGGHDDGSYTNSLKFTFAFK